MKNHKAIITFTVLLLSLSQNIKANTLTGKANNYIGLWLTEDSETIVKITHCGESLCGRITGFIDNKKDKKPSKSEEKEGMTALKEICSKDLLGGFKKTQDSWKKGWVIDVESDKKYSANLQFVNSNTLKLHAYEGMEILGESFLWTRTDNVKITCHSILTAVE